MVFFFILHVKKQLFGVKKNIVLVFVLFAGIQLMANDVSNRVNEISSLIYSHPDSASSLAMELMDDATRQDDPYGVVQSNFILAYLNQMVFNDYGKAVIYYLEAIRYAKKSNYPGAQKDLISFYKNCGVIFRKFKAYDLSKNYYEKGLELANQLSIEKQIVSIKYNLSGILLDEMDYDGAAAILEILITEKISGNKYFDILNRLSHIYIKRERYDKAANSLNEILSRSDESPKKIIAYAYQNLGTIESIDGDFHQADSLYQLAFQSIQLIESPPVHSVFEIHLDAARNFVLWEKNDIALQTFAKAEELIGKITQLPEYFEIYKSLADLHFALRNYHEAKKYEDLYSKSLNQYLNLQEEIQESDRRYNMDLITKRYFDEVAKQERIASILFYSKLISGSLLALLLFSVGYNWYQKVRLRRSIVKELVNLKVID